ncbi:hypothetical protein A3C87_03640 [Candidatus Kaiserbacteria bacterium RIFCSPHIGHO2_02_FULL_49_34]|uniref:Uncharacterized protein n=1 Tax=Candidatus Kaiserbacteria bacterium RIFCSPHIGHO2_02_FULL_49_34 TaxID=1798491 RepID=A0A1F6DJL3_9BACT|nr:MAG: hypothetical protein A3C87_03640 [Candidatus Kaiserbacteria bacterium RIFCSPHIGHO2_02_FULL_49_34]
MNTASIPELFLAGEYVALEQIADAGGREEAIRGALHGLRHCLWVYEHCSGELSFIAAHKAEQYLTDFDVSKSVHDATSGILRKLAFQKAQQYARTGAQHQWVNENTPGPLAMQIQSAINNLQL